MAVANPSQLSLEADGSEHSVTAEPVLPPSLPSPPPSALPELAVFDLELLHHYMTSTCYTLSRVSSVQTVWRDEAPRVGFSIPYVLHALLAVAALHLAWSDPTRRSVCIPQAQIHHSIAIRAALPMFPDTTTANSIAMFLFSSLTCVFSCASVHQGTNFLVLFNEGQLSAWARLFRGTKAIIERGNVDFHQGTLAPIFNNGISLFAMRSSAQMLEVGHTFVWELEQMIIRETSQDERLYRIYQDAITELSRTLAVALKPGDVAKLESADVFVWILEVSDEFLELLRQETPIALIIFAYFCVCIRKIEWMWWADGLSERLLTQLHTALDKRYHGWLTWPKEQIGWKGAFQ